MSIDPRKIVEDALTETLYRHIYFGHQIHKELALLQDVIEPTNQLALDFVQSWMLTLDLNEVYRKSVVMNNLIDLHHLIVTHTLPQASELIEEVLSV